MSQTDSGVGAWGQQFGDGWSRFWFTPSDPYPLGVIRACVGLLALYFQLSYTPDLVRFFGGDGLLTLSLTEQWNGGASAFNPGRISYLNQLQTPAALYAGHAVGAAILFLMTIGLFSRVTTVLGLYVVLSYIQRAPMITTQLETILSMLMLYLCVGPSGASWSVDRWLARHKAAGPAALAHWDRPRYSATIAIRLIQIHLSLACLMMGLAKVRGVSSPTGDIVFDPWGSGDAVWWMIARPDSPWVNLTWLRDWPHVVNAWTHAIVIFELTFPVLVWNRLTRPLMLSVAALMWGSLALISGVAPFSLAMLIANLAFFPPDVLRRFTRGESTLARSASEGALGLARR